MRVLIDRLNGFEAGRELDLDQLREVYAVPRLPWLRANMVQTMDGAATGANGRTGSINNAADKVVFDLIRSLADVIVVGAGTARAEGYEATQMPIVLVSRVGAVPEALRAAPAGMVVMVTCAEAPALPETADVLGRDNVVVLGREAVQLGALREALVDRGHRSLLCEGGPQLLSGLLEAGEVDELCASMVPKLVGGPHPRITGGPDLDVRLDLGVLLEESGTLIGRWLT